MVNQSEFRVRALLLGERLELRTFSVGQQLARIPLAISVGTDGVAVLFRYGAIVLFNTTPEAEKRLLDDLQPRIIQPHERVESEQAVVRVDPDCKEEADGDAIWLRSADVPRLQLVADVLAKSVMLAWHESEVARSFDRIEPLASRLGRQGRHAGKLRELLRHVGVGLAVEHRMIGRAEVGDKPELLWEKPELEGLYLGLEHFYEIRERDAVLRRKLDVVSRTVQTALELLHARQSLRVEWYIVILIVFDIVLSLAEKFAGSGH